MKLSKMPDSRPPEMRNSLQASRESIEAATELFEKNFDDDGRATTKKGQELCRRHGWSYWEEYPYTINGLMKWVRKVREAFKSERYKTLEAQIQVLTDQITNLRRRVGDLEDDFYKEEEDD